MRCACCNRVINPSTAWSDHHGRKYGPVCATKQLGYRESAPKRKPRITQFILSGPRIVIRVDDGQAELFSAPA